MLVQALKMPHTYKVRTKNQSVFHVGILNNDKLKQWETQMINPTMCICVCHHLCAIIEGALFIAQIFGGNDDKM